MIPAMYVCSSCLRLLPRDAERCPEDSAPARHVDAAPAGVRIGAYRIVRLMGEGGMGFVYEAHHDVLGRRAALKLLRDELVTNQSVVTRFLQEAKAVNLVDDDHIIDIYDVSDGEDGAVYFVMEYLEGQSLEALLEEHGRLSLPRLVQVFSQVMSGLASAHAKQIVHRDLKPANVFVIRREDNPWFVKLLDFGVAKLTGEGAVPGLTRAGALIGTPQYMSPEQFEGAQIDARADVFALGVMLYRSAVGREPFRGASLAELAKGILSEAPTPPSVAAPDANIPEALERLIHRALEKRPEDRYPRVVDMLRDLEALAPPEEQSAPAGSAPASPRAGPRDVAAPTSRRKWPLALGAGLALAAALAGAALTGGSSSESEADGAPDTLAAVAESEGARAAAARAEGELLNALESRGDARDALVRALGYAGTASAGPIFEAMLSALPDVRVRAAEIMADREIPEAASRIRSALESSGHRLRVDLAIALLALGEPDATELLEKALARPGGPGGPGGDVKTADALEDVLERTAPERARWRLAARGFLRADPTRAEARLRDAIEASDAPRSIAAAEILASEGDEEARALLERVARDPKARERMQAALALARMGNDEALTAASSNLGAKRPADRARAAAVTAHLASSGGREHLESVASLATDDPDLTVRTSAKVALLAFPDTRRTP